MAELLQKFIVKRCIDNSVSNKDKARLTVKILIYRKYACFKGLELNKTFILRDDIQYLSSRKFKIKDRDISYADLVELGRGYMGVALLLLVEHYI